MRSATAAAASRAPRASVSLVAPPRCGVMNTCGRSSSGCRAPPAGGSTTSRAAPASCPRRSASASSASSTSDSRAVLMKLAPGFISAKALAPNRCRLSAVARACTETMSDSASSSSKLTRVDRVRARTAGGSGSWASTVKPRAAARIADLPADVPEADQAEHRAGGLGAEELPALERRLGEPAAVGDEPAGPRQPADEHQRERDGQLGHRLGVLAGRADHRDAALASPRRRRR